MPSVRKVRSIMGLIALYVLICGRGHKNLTLIQLMLLKLLIYCVAGFMALPETPETDKKDRIILWILLREKSSEN